MELAIGRLKRGKRRKGVEVIDKASVNDALEDFGNEIGVRDRAVAGEIINRKRVFLVKGSDNGMFEGMWKGGLRNGKINESSNRKDENVKTRLEKSRGDEIKRASCIRGGEDSRSNLGDGSRKKGRKKRRGAGGGRRGEEKGREEEENEEVSLRILSPKKFKKEVARREGEEEGERGETDLRERRESREDHNLLGSLEVRVIRKFRS